MDELAGFFFAIGRIPLIRGGTKGGASIKEALWSTTTKVLDGARLLQEWQMESREEGGERKKELSAAAAVSCIRAFIKSRKRGLLSACVCVCVLLGHE